MANEDFTSKKTQIIGTKNPIKEVFRVREGGVVVTSFESTRNGEKMTYDTIPIGTLLVVDKQGNISPCPVDAEGHIKMPSSSENPEYYFVGFTINDVTPDRPQASVMTWGIYNPYGCELATTYPFKPDPKNVDGLLGLLAYGINITFESDNLIVPPNQAV